MNVFCLGAEQVSSLWPHVLPCLKKFEATRGIDYADDLKQDLLLAKKQLWGVQDGSEVLFVILTRVNNQPRGMVCEIYGTAGHGSDEVPFRREGVAKVMNEIERWAKSIGCRRMTFAGRKGWKRLLADYEEVGVVMEKEL